MTRAESRALWLVAAVHLLQWAAVASVPGLADLYILDSRVYDEMANGFVAEGWFAGNEAFVQAPLYPLGLAALRTLGLVDPLWPLALQVALGVANAALVGGIARQTFGRASAAPAVLLYGLYGAAAMLETKLMATTLGVFLLLAALRLLVANAARARPWSPFVAAGLLGAACLVRANTLLFVPMAVGYVLITTGGVRSPRAWSRALLFGLTVLLAIAPVSLRNLVVSGEPVLISTHGGHTLFESNNPRARGTYSSIPGAAGNPREIAEKLRTRLEAERGEAVSLAEVDRVYRDRALSFLVEDPVRTMGLMLRKLRFWLGNSEISTEYSLANERVLTPTLWLLPVPFALVLALAIFGGIECLRLRRGSAAAALLAAYVVSNLATVMVFFFASRYRVPAVAALSVFAGFGVAQLLEAWRDRSDASRVCNGRALAVAAAAFVTSLIPVSRDAERHEALQWFNYGVAFDERGDVASSIDGLERAAEQLDDYWRVQFALGRAYEKAGRLDDALDRYRRVRELRPKSDAIRHIRAIEARQSAEVQE